MWEYFVRELVRSHSIVYDVVVLIRCIFTCDSESIIAKNQRKPAQQSLHLEQKLLIQPWAAFVAQIKQSHIFSTIHERSRKVGFADLRVA